MAKSQDAKKTAKKVLSKATPSPSNKNTSEKEAGYEQISYAAYLIYISRVENGIFGDEFGDWLAAEAALRVS